MSEFELVKVTGPQQLHENLEKLLKNKKHIDAISVVMDEIRVDLSRVANAFGNSDFRMKVKPGRGDEARAIVERLKTQDAPLRGQSEELFSLLAV